MKSISVGVTVAILAVATASANGAVIEVNGDVSDWVAAGLLQEDWKNDRLNPNGAVEILQWGATVADDTFYAVLVLNRPISDFDGVRASDNKARKLFAGAFLNVDGNVATSLIDEDNKAPGTDILIEWGRGVGEGSGTDKDYSFWGLDGNIGTVIPNGVAGGAHADSGDAPLGVLEWSAPIASITAALAQAVPAGQTPVQWSDNWTVVLGAQGTTRPDAGGDNYGYDYGNIVPEPSTLASLASLGIIGLIAAWRRRK